MAEAQGQWKPRQSRPSLAFLVKRGGLTVRVQQVVDLAMVPRMMASAPGAVPGGTKPTSARKRTQLPRGHQP
jgi:hypothetical protein